MGYIILIILVIIVLFVVSRFIPFDKELGKPTVYKDRYSYKAKEHVMTSYEEMFFRTLSDIVGEKYYIFPQVHLSTVLDHKIPKQNWSYALRHINQKSVDFVLCDKNSLKPVYAVELDDRTHDSAIRIERDRIVEAIFKNANFPLVRFRDFRNLSKEDVIAKFQDAHDR